MQHKIYEKAHTHFDTTTTLSWCFITWLLKRNNLFCFLLAVLAIVNGCMSDQRMSTRLESYRDTSIAVYGPYAVYKLPINKGVKILNPLQLCYGPGDKMFASNQSGELYYLVDTDKDELEDSAALYVNLSEKGLHSAASMAYHKDTVFVGTREGITAFLDQNRDGQADTSWNIFRDIPQSEHPYEWTSGLTLAKDGYLYFALTTDSWNAGASPDFKKYRGSILRIATNGGSAEVMATGIRSVHGMSQHTDGHIFFTDNAGGGNPTEELNLLRKGSFYGHNKKKFKDTLLIEKPVLDLTTEVAPAQIIFNNPENDFGGSSGDLFVAYYGPAERWERGAVGRVRMSADSKSILRFEELRVADIPKLSGIAFGKNGTLYAAHHGRSDYWYNSIEPVSGGFYKIIYNAAVAHRNSKDYKLNQEVPAASSIEKGKILFKERACFACHSAENDEDLLGPPLKGIRDRLARSEILQEINMPSKVIKSSMGATRITKKNGQVLLGRMVSSDATSLSLMLIGNSVMRIERSEINKIEEERKSLMYENLLNGLSEQEINNLIDYLLSLK